MKHSLRFIAAILIIALTAAHISSCDFGSLISSNMSDKANQTKDETTSSDKPTDDLKTDSPSDNPLSVTEEATNFSQKEITIIEAESTPDRETMSNSKVSDELQKPAIETCPGQDEAEESSTEPTTTVSASSPEGSTSLQEPPEDVELEITVEDFVHSRIRDQLSLYYEVFFASVIISGETIHGFGYTDFTEGYTIEGDTRTFFSAGFLPFLNESLSGESISSEEIEIGTEIHRTNAPDEKVGFILGFEESYSAHCVYSGSYLVYGFSAEGIFFSQEEFSREIVDLSLGSLYSYDEQRVLFEESFGNNKNFTGVSASKTINYEELTQYVNTYLEQQDRDFLTIDTYSAVYVGKEALQAYFLSLQEETFCGYLVSELEHCLGQLDPLQCLRITADGLYVVDIQAPPPPGSSPSSFTKWMVGLVSGIAVVGGAALVALGAPLLGGAVIGAAIETACEVILENKTLSALDWRKVVISSIAGAVSIHMPLAGDAIVGGITNSAFVILEGGSAQDAVQSFAVGTMAGIVIGGAFKLAGSAIGTVTKKKISATKVSKLSAVDNKIRVFDKVAQKVDDPLTASAKYHSSNRLKIDVQLFAAKSNSSYVDDFFLSSDMEQKILYGQRTKGNTIRGGHSPRISFADSNYAVEILSRNADGTSQVKYVTQFADGALSKTKNSTLFPQSWSDAKIIESVKRTASTPPMGTRIADGVTIHRSIVDGVQIEVMKSGIDITTGYPTGTVLSKLPDGFVGN